MLHHAVSPKPQNAPNGQNLNDPVTNAAGLHSLPERLLIQKIKCLFLRDLYQLIAGDQVQTMYNNIIIADTKWRTGLQKLDREEGCPHCGGKLHTAHNARKPKGLNNAMHDQVLEAAN